MACHRSEELDLKLIDVRVDAREDNGDDSAAEPDAAVSTTDEATEHDQEVVS